MELPRWNGSNTLASAFSEMPQPVSVTLTAQAAGVGVSDVDHLPPAAAYLLRSTRG